MTLSAAPSGALLGCGRPDRLSLRSRHRESAIAPPITAFGLRRIRHQNIEADDGVSSASPSALTANASDATAQPPPP